MRIRYSFFYSKPLQLPFEPWGKRTINKGCNFDNFPPFFKGKMEFLLVGRVGLEPTRPLRATGLQPATLPVTFYLPIIAVWLTFTYFLTAKERYSLPANIQGCWGLLAPQVRQFFVSQTRHWNLPQSFSPNGMEQENRPNPWSRHGGSNPDSPA